MAMFTIDVNDRRHELDDPSGRELVGGAAAGDRSQKTCEPSSVHYFAVHQIVRRFEMRNFQGAHRLNGQREGVVGTTCRVQVS
jgi:hypothetical protein